MKLTAWVVFVLLVSGLAFGATILGIPTAYYWWLQYQCWRAGPDSQECWWLDLLEHPHGNSAPRTPVPRMR
jgi:hypothetical protein